MHRTHYSLMNDRILPYPNQFFARFPLRYLFKGTGEARAGGLFLRSISKHMLLEAI